MCRNMLLKIFNLFCVLFNLFVKIYISMFVCVQFPISQGNCMDISNVYFIIVPYGFASGISIKTKNCA